MQTLLYSLFITLYLCCLITCKKHSSSDTPVYLMHATDTMKAVLRKAYKARSADYRQSLSLYKEAIALGRSIGDNAGLVQAYRSGAFVAGALLNDTENALAISDEALIFSAKLGDANTLCDMYGMRGVIYQAAGNTDSAIAAGKLALKYMDEDTAPDSLKNWPLYLNIADLYSQLDNQRLAIEYTNKYLDEYVLKIKDTMRMITSYNNLGVYYTLLDDSVNAYENTYKAWQLFTAKPDKQNEASIYSGMFAMYNNRGMYDSALFFCEKSIVLFEQSGNTQRLFDATHNLMEIAVNAKDAKLAMAVLQKPVMTTAFHLFATQEDQLSLRSRKNFAENLSYLYSLTRDEKKGYQYLKIAYQLNGLLRTQETNKAMEEYELNRKKVLQEKLLLTRQLQIERKDNTILLLVILFIAAFSTALLLFVWYNRKSTLQKKKIEYLEKQKEWEREKSLMEGQLEERNRISRELHDDLGASLTSIVLASDLLKNKKGDALASVLMISDTATASIDSLNEIVWSLNSRNDSMMGLIAYIRKFAVSFLDKSGIVLHTSESLPGTDLVVTSNIRRYVYLTAKECLNNIVKHSNATAVHLGFFCHSSLLLIKIQDNGKGIDTSKQYTGNGLHNMKKNMDNIGGNIQWTSDNGTLVEISVKLD
ncbi:MAG: hypothetical protein KF746_01370 [Chitinophagaceae bacterium]|nr:hypothetical protein [Chitinophagaceae bacterium]